MDNDLPFPKLVRRKFNSPKFFEINVGLWMEIVCFKWPEKVFSGFSKMHLIFIMANVTASRKKFVLNYQPDYIGK